MRKSETLEPLLSAPEVARLLNMSRAGAWRQIWSGELPSVRIGGRVLVDPRDLREFIDARRTSSNSEDDDGRESARPTVTTSAGGAGGDDTA